MSGENLAQELALSYRILAEHGVVDAALQRRDVSARPMAEQDVL